MIFCKSDKFPNTYSIFFFQRAIFYYFFSSNHFEPSFLGFTKNFNAVFEYNFLKESFFICPLEGALIQHVQKLVFLSDG